MRTGFLEEKYIQDRKMARKALLVFSLFPFPLLSLFFFFAKQMERSLNVIKFELSKPSPSAVGCLTVLQNFHYFFAQSRITLQQNA